MWVIRGKQPFTIHYWVDCKRQHPNILSFFYLLTLCSQHQLKAPNFLSGQKKKHRLTALSFNKIHQNIVQSGQIIISPYRCDCGLLSFCCSKLLPIFCLSKPAHGIPCSYCSTRPCGFESNL